MPQNAVCTATIASQAFPAGTQAGGNYRFRALSSNGVTTTQLETVPVSTYVGLSTGLNWTFKASRLGVDGVTQLGSEFTVTGVIITADVTISVVAGLSVSVVQAT